jgi:hypothetical protein
MVETFHNIHLYSVFVFLINLHRSYRNACGVSVYSSYIFDLLHSEAADMEYYGCHYIVLSLVTIIAAACQTYHRHIFVLFDVTSYYITSVLCHF